MALNLANSKIELCIENGTLRSLMLEDVHSGYVNGLNDPEVNRYLVGAAQSEQTFESVISFVEHAFAASNDVLFGIWQEGKKNHCGTVRLHGIDTYHLTAHIGVCLFDKRAWGQGLASKAICAVTDWGLGSLGLRWIEAGIYQDNIASEKLFERCGYKKKYTVSGKYLLRGSPSDAFVYAACPE